MNDWLRVVITVGVITSSMKLTIPITGPDVTRGVEVTHHVSREAAIEAEAHYRAEFSHKDTWYEDWMEWSGRFTRTVLLVHGNTVELLTFRPKTKKVTKEVDEPDGETAVLQEVKPETIPVGNWKISDPKK